MAITKKISAYDALTSPASGDLLEIVDVSDTTAAPTGTNKKIAVSDLVSGGVVPDDSVTNAKLANMAQATIKGRAAGAGTGDPTDLSAAQATAILNAVVGDSGSGGTKGLVPAPGAGDAAAGKFLKADGTFAVPAGSGIGGSTGSTDNALLRADGTGGSTAQASAVSVDDNGAITVPEIAAPGTPAAGKVVIYAKSDNKVYRKGEDGVEAELGGGGGGTNPTSGAMPYNNAGAFADSHLTRTSASVTTIANGTVLRAGTSSYAYGFTAQTTSGMWLEGTDQLHFSIQGKHSLNVFFQNSSRHCVLVEQGQGVLGFGTTSLQAGFYMPGGGHVAVIADADSPPTNSGTLYSPRRELETSSNNLIVNMAKGNVRGFTLNNDYNMNAPTNARSGTILTIRIKQSAGGGNTVTWNSAYKWAGGSAPTITATANAVDIFTFLLDGTNAEEISRAQNVS